MFCVRIVGSLSRMFLSIPIFTPPLDVGQIFFLYIVNKTPPHHNYQKIINVLFTNRLIHYRPHLHGISDSLLVHVLHQGNDHLS